MVEHTESCRQSNNTIVHRCRQCRHRGQHTSCVHLVAYNLRIRILTWYMTYKCTDFRKNEHDHVLQWTPRCNINKHSNHVCCMDWRRTLAWYPKGAAPTVAAPTSGKAREGRMHCKEDRRWPGLGSNSTKQRRGRAVVEFYITWSLWNVVLIIDLKYCAWQLGVLVPWVSSHIV